MAKSLFSKRDGIWILVPNLGVLPRSQKNITYLEIFYLFGQIPFIQLFYKRGGKDGEKNEEIDHFKRTALIHLGTRIESLKWFAKLLRRQQKIIIRKEWLRNKLRSLKKVWGAKEEEIFLAYLLAYTNMLMTIKEVISENDKELGTPELSKDLEDKDWFQYADAVRQACQHEETPLVTVDKKSHSIDLTFNRLAKLDKRHHKRFQWIASEQRHTIGVDCADIDDDCLEYLNEWAKRHLDRIDLKEEMNVVSSFDWRGRAVFTKITLGDLLARTFALEQ